MVPPRNAVGTNTAASTSTIATTGPDTSRIARNDASRAERPFVFMFASTASITTIASSTTMPIASTMPNSVSRLIEKPSIVMPTNVPTIETTTASVGISVARRFCRNRYTTSTTSTTASSSVFTTSSIEAVTNFVVSSETS